MATKIVLDETRKVLELMEESEEKVSLLQQDLKQNENLYGEVKQELNSLRELTNKNSADLEDNQNLKTNIKEYNLRVVNLAQQIYACGQQLYNEISLHETGLERIEKMFNKNESKYLEKLNAYRVQGEKLKLDLENVKDEENKKEQQKELESQLLNKENKELQDELTRISEDIQKCQYYINEGVVLNQQELAYKEEITKIQEYLNVTANEINAVARLLDELEGYREKSENEADNYISELEKKIKYLDSETEVALKVLEENKIQNDQLLEELKEYEIDNKEKECEKYKNCIKEFELNMKATEENTEKEIAMCEKAISECEDNVHQKELNCKLNMDINSFEVKTKKLDEEINRISMDIESSKAKKSNVDLKQEFKFKEEELIQLKSARRNLKEEYNKKLLDFQTETKNLQDEIEGIELKNKNLDEEIDRLDSEIIQLKTSEGSMTNEKQQAQKKSNELEAQIRHSTFELTKAKSEMLNKRKTIGTSKAKTAPKSAYQPSCSDQKPKIHRHWDSDSSIEGEDRRFSNLAKQRVRMRNLQKNKN